MVEEPVRSVDWTGLVRRSLEAVDITAEHEEVLNERLNLALRDPSAPEHDAVNKIARAVARVKGDVAEMSRTDRQALLMMMLDVTKVSFGRSVLLKQALTKSVAATKLARAEKEKLARECLSLRQEVASKDEDEKEELRRARETYEQRLKDEVIRIKSEQRVSSQELRDLLF